MEEFRLLLDILYAVSFADTLFKSLDGIIELFGKIAQFVGDLFLSNGFDADLLFGSD